MSIEGSTIAAAIALGVGATLVMDLWNLFLKRAFGIPSLNYCMLGPSSVRSAGSRTTRSAWSSGWCSSG